MEKRKLIVLCLCVAMAFSNSVCNASTGSQQAKYIDNTATADSDTEIVLTGNLYIQDSVATNFRRPDLSTRPILTDWDMVVYALINGWDISRQDWWDPFDNNVDEWAKFKIGVQLSSEDGISVKINTSGSIYKNGSYWGGIASTSTYGDELIVTRKDSAPDHGDDYETTAYHKVWDDNGVNVLNKTTVEEFSF